MGGAYYGAALAVFGVALLDAAGEPVTPATTVAAGPGLPASSRPQSRLRDGSVPATGG